MIRRLVLRKLDAVEKDLGGSVDYLRHMVGVCLPAFFKFIRIMPMAQYRKALPPEPCHVARLVAARDEDCGTCVQIGVNLARKEGVAPDVLRAVLDRRPEDLPGDLADVYRFAEAVVTATGGEDALRRKIRDRYGERGLVELALAMASSRVFPITKRALGYSQSCANMTVVIP